MQKILVSWIGRTDLKAAAGEDVGGVGPIAQAAGHTVYDYVYLLSNYPQKDTAPFIDWFKSKTDAQIEFRCVPLSSPMHFGEIYEATRDCVSTVVQSVEEPRELTFHLSPGTSAMAAVWILLAKTRFRNVRLIQSSVEQGVVEANVPFDISADFIPDLMKEKDAQLNALSGEAPPEKSEFSKIIYRSQAMARVIHRAQKVATRSNIPVLIEGETGTGKEMLALAIHLASNRQGMPFIPVNCGAIPSELIESQLFGHERGAFTGADKRHIGFFETANGGTIFLDELGEMPAMAQVKMLRVIQENEITRVGGTHPMKIDVRIISATNRSLIEEVAANRFREDLFYRLAVAVLNLPPLRERNGDLNLLITKLLDRVNEESKEQPGYEYKKISAGAKNIMLNHDWPGNVRELLNTIRRAALWSEGKTISAEDVQEAVFPSTKTNKTDLLNQPLGNGFKIQELLDKVTVRYLNRALDESSDVKKRAAQLLGLSNYQTLNNWLDKHGIKR